MQLKLCTLELTRLFGFSCSVRSFPTGALSTTGPQHRGAARRSSAAPARLTARTGRLCSPHTDRLNRGSRWLLPTPAPRSHFFPRQARRYGHPAHTRLPTFRVPTRQTHVVLWERTERRPNATAARSFAQPRTPRSGRGRCAPHGAASSSAGAEVVLSA